MIHILRVHPRSTHSWDRGDGNLKRRQYTVLQFFQLLIWTSERKSVDTPKKSGWKLAQLPNLKVIQRAKFQKFTDVCMVGAITQMSVKFRDFVMHVICSKFRFQTWQFYMKKRWKNRGRAYLYVFLSFADNSFEFLPVFSVTLSPWVS